MTEFAPIRASDNVVEVAEAVKVMSPVLLILPSITLLIVMAHCLAWALVSGLVNGTLRN